MPNYPLWALQSVHYLTAFSLNLRSSAEGTECKTSAGARFKLIKRTAKGHEVWEEEDAKLYISSVVDKEIPPYNVGVVEGFHGIPRAQAMNLCEAPSTLDERGNLSDLHWRVPTASVAGWPTVVDGKCHDRELMIGGLCIYAPVSDFPAMVAGRFQEAVADVTHHTKLTEFWSSNHEDDGTTVFLIVGENNANSSVDYGTDRWPASLICTADAP